MSRPHIDIAIESETAAKSKAEAAWKLYSRPHQVADNARIDIHHCGKSNPDESGCFHTAEVLIPLDYTLPDGKTPHPRAGMWTSTGMHIAQALELCRRSGDKYPIHQHIADACRKMTKDPHPMHLKTTPPGNWPVPPTVEKKRKADDDTKEEKEGEPKRKKL